MKDQYFDNPAYDQDDQQENMAYNSSAEEDSSEAEENVFSYTDEEHSDEEDIARSSAASSNGKRKKSAERVASEEKFLALYEEYMRPTKQYSAFRIQCQLDDMLALLYQLNKSWAYYKAKRYKLAGFRDADGDEALDVGCMAAYNMLKEEKASGIYCTYPIAHYLRITQNNAIDDYFRHEFGHLRSTKKSADATSDEELPQIDKPRRRRKNPILIGLDEPISDSDSRTRGEATAELSVDPFANPQRPRWERDEKAVQMQVMFLRELMDYPNDPPKPLALMYGNVLFQLFKDYGGNSELSQLAKKSTKLSSPEWAHQLMGDATLLQLGMYAERTVQKSVSKSLTWGKAFTQHMLERTADGSRRVWAGIIYTKTYSLDNTSNWIESIMRSTQEKCCRKMQNNPDLVEYAIETLGAKNKFRRALEKTKKEDRK